MARRTCGSRVSVRSVRTSSSRVSFSEKLCRSPEKFPTEKNAWELYDPK